jgi:hypothetical protein
MSSYAPFAVSPVHLIPKGIQKWLSWRDAIGADKISVSFRELAALKELLAQVKGGNRH